VDKSWEGNELSKVQRRRTAAFDDCEVFLVAPGFTNEVGFERFQALVAGADVAVKRYGIVQFP